MEDLILLVEDDLQFGETVKDYFISNGLSVLWAKDGATAVLLFKDEHPKLVLLDVMLPDKNGFQVADEIKKINSAVPLIFMTGTALSENDYNNGFQKLYAENYLEKPIKLYAILAQVMSLLYPPSVKTYNGNNIYINIDNQQLTINDNIFNLRENNIKIFSVLLDNVNCSVKRSDILFKIWNDNRPRLNNALDNSISRIKKILKDFPDIKLKTIYGRGYLLSILQ